MRFVPLIFFALVASSAAADAAAETTTDQILDGWRQIERDDRTFAYEAELIEYQHATIPVGDDELLENCLHARACDGGENREFRLNLMGRNSVQGSFSKRATPEVSTYLHYSSPLWLAHQPLALLKAFRCDISRAAAKPNSEGNFEVVFPGHLPNISFRVDVSPSAPYRPVALQVERGGRPFLAWELLLPTDGRERFHVAGWKYKRFSDGGIDTLTTAKVTKFTASPEINDSTFTLKFPLGAHIVGRADDEASRTYWIQDADNELRRVSATEYFRDL
jgi:hypothetical protein